MSKSRNDYWLVVLAIALLGININYPTDSQILRINSNPCYSLLFTLWVLILFQGLRKGKIRLVLKYDWFVGLIFSLLYCITFAVNNNLGKTYFNGGLNIVFTTFSILSWMIVYTLTFSYVRCHFGIVSLSTSITPKMVYIWLLLAVIWGISIIGLLPGQISWDGMRQFCEFDGTHIAKLDFTYVPTNHHPWITTIIFGTLFNIGKSMLGVNFGVFIIIIVQFIISSIIYTFIIKYVWQRIGKFGGLFTFILFASPYFSSYIVTIDKSTLYYAFTAWFYLMFAKLFESINRETKPWNYIGYCVSALLFSLFRNDAFLIVIVATTILLCLFIKNKVRLVWIASVFIFLLGIHFGWNAYLNQKQVIKSSPSEALTIPTRQLSNIYLTDKDYLNKADLEKINKITPLSQIKSKYNVNNGDGLKSLYPSDTFLNTDYLIEDVVQHKLSMATTKKEEKEIVEYLKVWAKVGVKDPVSYIQVYLTANSGYLNPFINYNASLFLDYYPKVGYFMQPSWYKRYHALFSNETRQNIYTILSMFVMFPPLAIICNPATLAWVSLVLFFILIKKRLKKELLFILPLLIMCILFTITSVNGYTRYTLGALAALPIVISYLWVKLTSLKKVKEK